MRENQVHFNNIVRWLVDSELRNLTGSVKIRIDDLDEPSAIALGSLLQTELDRIAPEAAIKVRVPSVSLTEPDGIRISRDNAVWLRNREDRLVLIVPTSVSASLSSAGPDTFSKISIAQHLDEIVDFVLDKHADRSYSSQLRQLLAPLKKRDIAYSRLLFVSNALQFDSPVRVGLLLPHLGLIPDAGEDFAARLDVNLRVSDTLLGRSKPLSTSRNRLTEIGLEDEALFEQIVETMENASPENSDWLWSLSEKGHTFEKWGLHVPESVSMDTVSLKSFFTPSGQLSENSKLVEDGATFNLIASGRVFVEWETSPPRAEPPAWWEMTVVPAGSSWGDASVEICRKRVRGQRKSQLLTWTLDPDITDASEAHEVRIVAIDSQGVELSNASGQRISSESEPFYLTPDEAGDESESVASDDNQYIAALRRVLAGKPFEELTRSVWSEPLGELRFAFGAGNWSTSSVSSFLLSLQGRSLKSSRPLTFSSRTDFGVTGLASNLVAEELSLPAEFESVRRKTFEVLSRSVKGDAFAVEAIVWNPKAIRAAESYAKAYSEALANANRGMRKSLLLIDTIHIQVLAEQQTASAVVVMPLHPARLLWMARYAELVLGLARKLEVFSPNKRHEFMEWSLIENVNPSHFPFVSLGFDGLQYDYREEISFGTGLYLAPDTVNVDTSSAAIRYALGVPLAKSNRSNLPKLAEQRLARYVKSHELNTKNGLKIAVVNSGDGEFASELIKLNLKNPDMNVAKRFHVVAFADNQSRVNPLSGLRAISSIDFGAQVENVTNGFLDVPLEIESKPLSELSFYDGAFHVATIHNLASNQGLTTVSDPGLMPYLDGLITRVQTRPVQEGSGLFLAAPSLAKTSETGGKQALSELHRSFIQAMSDVVFERAHYLASQFVVSSDVGTALQRAHDKADWVITVDRAIGLAALERNDFSGSSHTLVLDYAPDFVDGVGERITVTTSKAQEIESVIANAMTKLHFDNKGVTSSDMLRNLGSVSGQLALRLLSDDTQAQEAVGLAAVTHFLDKHKLLENTIIVPVDSHLDIFGRNSRGVAGEAARRCDMILVRFRDMSPEYELIEVKARSGAVDAELPRRMAQQLSRTESILKNRLYSPLERADSALQWVRWSSMLEFYADRAANTGRFQEAELSKVKEAIQRLEQGKSTKHRFKRTGYIVTIGEGSAGQITSPEGMKLEILDRARLLQSGFTLLE